MQLFAAAVFALLSLQFSTVSAQTIWEGGSIENGQSLFNANCASCHKVTDEVLAAPGLAGIADRWGACGFAKDQSWRDFSKCRAFGCVYQI